MSLNEQDGATETTLTHEEARERIAELRRVFNAGLTRPLEWRQRQLRQLRAMLTEQQDVLLGALHKDLRKSHFEGELTELNFVVGEIDMTLKQLHRWMKPRKVALPLAQQPGSGWVQPEPLGVALIIGPWNYPVNLTMAPLVGALAAGNCVALKPSEVAPATAEVLADLIPRYLDSDAVQVFQGGPAETGALLAQRFDHIFFTGGETVGRIVMRAAAEHLTPVVLELGGKSPCIVDQNTDLDLAARRIVWGKYLNCGQTCIAPDYLLVHRAIRAQLVQRMVHYIGLFFGDDPARSPDYGRIINARHHRRLVGLMGEHPVAAGGTHDEADLYIAPTILEDVPHDAPVMREEIFGPLMPVLEINAIEDAIAFINERPKPLALYLFSAERATQEEVLARTSSGGVCVNDTIMHIGVPNLPFGGVGASGMGAYHGRASFDVFSHHKAILSRSTRVDPALRYPPYTDFEKSFIRKLY